MGTLHQKGQIVTANLAVKRNIENYPPNARLNFWKQFDKQTHRQAVPTDPVIWFFRPKFGEVVTERDEPGGDLRISNILPTS